ncbi:hypothetical protein J3R30DRAFT_3696523 [Lentinula aciculospora]|uniref:DUF6534 domain-containing protein n=1 Tax=Lentinula aciculospora TaxID=153920 RepID=A0A9W9ANZ1_9AGAR|nr:hypothetical protein J3R30DRAFT_3696523 [Lentinula aciculospora]
MESAAPVFHVELTFGPILIGVFLNMILFGVLLNQAGDASSPMHSTILKPYSESIDALLLSKLPVEILSDAWCIQILVAYLFVLEIANTALDMAMIYQPLITEYGVPPFPSSSSLVELWSASSQERKKLSWNFPSYLLQARTDTDIDALFRPEPIIMAMISLPIQSFFAWRIQMITKSYWIPLSLADGFAVGGVITGIKFAIIKLFARKPELHWCALLWFLTSGVADLLITITLVISLYRRKTGFSATDSLINQLIRLTIQTGMITAICAICAVIFFMALPHTALNFPWDLMLSKFYTNCLMSNLNARSNLRHPPPTETSPSSLLMFNEMDSQRLRDIGQRPFASTMPNVYDLESARTFETAAHSSNIKRGDELEYGVSVTKVSLETFLKRSGI